ncbi:hypothetical protein HK101_007355 [Irineochytrium annulatum]|nr:hypothetical protein HK101_007355 [Irineochytrium annulatum]
MAEVTLSASVTATLTASATTSAIACATTFPYSAAADTIFSFTVADAARIQTANGQLRRRGGGYATVDGTVYVADYTNIPSKPTVTMTLDSSYTGLHYRYRYQSANDPAEIFIEGENTLAIVGILPTYCAYADYEATATFTAYPTPTPKGGLTRRGGNLGKLIPMFIDDTYNLEFEYTDLAPPPTPTATVSASVSESASASVSITVTTD